MATIITPSERVETVEHFLSFDLIGERGCGFSFPCDVHGTLLPRADGRVPANLAVAQDRTRYSAPYVQEYVHRYTVPAVLRCDCGATFDIPDFTNTCERCGADFNSWGQRLANRDCWGEESNESVSDILSVDWR